MRPSFIFVGIRKRLASIRPTKCGRRFINAAMAAILDIARGNIVA